LEVVELELGPGLEGRRPKQMPRPSQIAQSLHKMKQSSGTK
jgi:hypothetical protein